MRMRRKKRRRKNKGMKRRRRKNRMRRRRMKRRTRSRTRSWSRSRPNTFSLQQLLLPGPGAGRMLLLLCLLPVVSGSTTLNATHRAGHHHGEEDVVMTRPHIYHCRSPNMEDFTCWWRPLDNLTEGEVVSYVLTYSKECVLHPHLHRPSPSPSSSFTLTFLVLHPHLHHPSPSPSSSFTLTFIILHPHLPCPSPSPSSSFTLTFIVLHPHLPRPSPSPSSSFTLTFLVLHPHLPRPSPSPSLSFTLTFLVLHPHLLVLHPHLHHPSPSPSSSFTLTFIILYPHLPRPSPSPSLSFTLTFIILHPPLHRPSPSPSSSFTLTFIITVSLSLSFFQILLFLKGPRQECPDYTSAGPNSCHFDSSHTSIWKFYCMNVTAVTAHGNYTSQKHCLDVADIVQTEAPVNVTYTLTDPGGDEMGLNVLLSWTYPVPAHLQYGWITLMYELQYRRLTEPDNWKVKAALREPHVELLGLPVADYVIRVRCRSQNYGLWSEWSSTLQMSIPPTLPAGKLLVLILVTGVGVLALLVIAFGVIPQSRRIKDYFLPQIPKPRIMGIDPLLMKVTEI
ncbi:unnamed protein product [Pleuronectes platessa]|uniref:Fibronectin type-III domain-containing protein n=1 Tax=Pleuronectes platessa TaxID=8262 RepID=A0A9N7Z8E8_PLEPL|nr:unnamed protein product [Pleuronectes platessa]